MKVLALGGAGDMGRMAIAILLDSPSVTSITVADINSELLNTFVEMVDSPKLSAIQIDITEAEKIIDLISSHDIVINTVGPFYKFEIPIMEAVIAAKKPFLDICDDWKPTLDALEFNDKAKEAEITAIIGIGASPGVTNVMGVYACSKLDEIDELITAWGMNIDIKAGKKPKYYIKPEKLRRKLEKSERKPNAALIHLLFETIEKIPTFKDGKMIEIEPLTEVEPFDFPGFKSMYACNIGHPEPITLPRTIKVKSVSNVMYIGETATEITRKYSQKVKDKELTIEDATLALGKELADLTKRAFKDKAILEQYVGGPPTLSVIARGIKDGKRKKVAVGLDREPFGEMAGVTSVPLGIATIMLLEGKIVQKGVLTPEEAFKDNPMEFFDRIAPYCGKNLKGKDILIEREVNI
ncbi:MAG: saccharopine dehydrogenase family protein [Promethearchaeota archaeon]